MAYVDECHAAYKNDSASCKGQVDLARLLLEHGAEINLKCNKGRTPLHWGTEHEAIVRLLLEEEGVNVNVQDHEGMLPLHFATTNGQMDVAQLLLEHGIQLHRAADNKKEKEVRKLLRQGGTDIHCKNMEGNTPLHLASLKGHDAIAVLLLENGAV